MIDWPLWLNMSLAFIFGMIVGIGIVPRSDARP